MKPAPINPHVALLKVVLSGRNDVDAVMGETFTMRLGSVECDMPIDADEKEIGCAMRDIRRIDRGIRMMEYARRSRKSNNLTKP